MKTYVKEQVIEEPRSESFRQTNLWLTAGYGFVPAAMARDLYDSWSWKGGSLSVSESRLRRKFDWLSDEEYLEARDKLNSIRGMTFVEDQHVDDHWEVDFGKRLATRLGESKHYEIFDPGVYSQLGALASVVYAQVRIVCESQLKQFPMENGLFELNPKWHCRNRLLGHWSQDDLSTAFSQLVDNGFLLQGICGIYLLPEEERSIFLCWFNEMKRQRYSHYRPDWCPWVKD